MMTFGQKIKKLRFDAGLTQKDLADKMNVSFQTISKWESGQNEPDITSIKELCKIFNCSFEYLLGDDDKNEPEVEVKSQKQEDIVPIVVPVTKNKIGKCRDCSKDLYEDDLVHNIERKSPSGIKETVSICDECFKKHEAEIDQRVKEINESIKEPESKKSSTSKFSRIQNRDDSKVLLWSIIIGALSLVIALIICILTSKKIGIGWTIGIPLITGYVVFADIYCIFTASWVSDVFLEVASWSIKFPGIIFSFSLDGLKFLIAMKLLFWLLGVLLSIGAFLLAVVFSSICSIFTFPFLVVYNKNH